MDWEPWSIIFVIFDQNDWSVVFSAALSSAHESRWSFKGDDVWVVRKPFMGLSLWISKIHRWCTAVLFSLPSAKRFDSRLDQCFPGCSQPLIGWTIYSPFLIWVLQHIRWSLFWYSSSPSSFRQLWRQFLAQLMNMDTRTGLPGRTLVLCFDGTSDQYSSCVRAKSLSFHPQMNLISTNSQNTNIPRLYALLKKDDDCTEQLCYYQAGVGTWFNPGVVAPMFRWGAKILDEAFAWYLDAHVIDGYKFIMNNWKTGDKICLFGFSRGAYTARALAGALHKVGHRISWKWQVLMDDIDWIVVEG